MALFPAYADEAKKLENVQVESEENTWLKNSSFQGNLVIPNKKPQGICAGSNKSKEDESPSHCEIPPKAKKNKQKKKKIEPERACATKSVDENDYFVIDVKPVKEYLKVDTIYRPAVPKYSVKYYLHKKRKLRKFKRYFKSNLDKTNDVDEKKLTKENINTAAVIKQDENFTGFKEEEDLSKRTASYNKSLGENPNDINIWLEYSRFQDTVYEFEKTNKKGSIAKAQRVLAERKISIIETALTHNPNSESLLRELLKIAEAIYPSDELQEKLKKMVEHKEDNIILWQGYIEASQCSMTHCTAGTVLSLYTKCLSTLHKIRRTTSTKKDLSEENILRMLYQCGLFLKQTGLFEQLWALLKMYLDLNLSPSDDNKFNFARSFDEAQLQEYEDVVLDSRLPHHELWLRIEKLRESCHWLPYTGNEEGVDLQRMVFDEDVNELIHPITMPENIFKLVATVFTLLKVPLIPCRHATMQDLGLDYVPWSLDSIECLLPVYIRLYPLNIMPHNILKDINRFVVGPQYLRAIPGQTEYLNFILSLMESCADSLQGQDQISVRIWWFRFQRLLIVLKNEELFNMNVAQEKNIKSKIKSLLKRNRSNEVYYVEYALIEKELGNVEQCLNILQTALKMNQNRGIVTENWQQSQTNQCYLYKVLVESMIEVQADQTESVKLLLNLVLQRKVEVVNAGLLMEADTKFKLITDKLLEENVRTLTPVEHFLPDFVTDWIICNAWFIFLYKGILECGTFLETVLERLENKCNNVTYQKEIIFEFYSFILFKHCQESPGYGTYKILDDVLFRALQQHPNNLYLLSLLAKEQAIMRNTGPSFWKVQKLLLKSDRAIATLFSVIIFHLVQSEIEANSIDTISGCHVVSTNHKNKMLSLFKKITEPNMCTRRCGLAWRLYLRFVNNYRDVYYRAVEECPWLKALYMDAAVYIPAEFGKIQDLIIEKELRIHVTPEELDVLRS